MYCDHEPQCPSADAPDHESARVVSSHPEQGWSQLCNGVILFEDTGELLPDGRCIQPHRGPTPHNQEHAHASGEQTKSEMHPVRGSRNSGNYRYADAAVRFDGVREKARMGG